MHSNWMSPSEQSRIVLMYTTGMTIKRIMKETGRSYGGIHNVLHRAGVEMRPKGVRPRENDDTTVPRVRSDAKESE